MLRKTYDWVMRQAGSRHAPTTLFAVSFAESSFFPIPPDVMLAPMVVARPDRAYVLAGICTLASVLGGILGYAIGYFLEPVGHWLLALMGQANGDAAFRAWFEQWGLMVILIKGLTPIPYKLVTIASGAAHFDLFTFVWASIVTRGARFFLVSALLWKFGEPIRTFVEKRLTLLTWLFLIALVGGFVAFRYIF